jgi:hypothetical protein
MSEGLTWGFNIIRTVGSGGGTYNPTSYFTGGTVGPWYDFGDSTKILNSSDTSATNGQTIKTVTDAGTAGINASQATDASRPTLSTNFANGKSAALCTATQLFDATGLNAFSNAANNLSILAVFQPTDGTTNHCIFQQYDNPWGVLRAYAGYVGLQPSVRYDRDGTAYANLRSGTAVSAATTHAMVIQIDALNGQTGIYLDNGTSLTMQAAGGSTVAGVYNSTNGNESVILRQCKGYCLDIYIHKNAMMDATQRGNWFTAVKSRFSLTAY